MLTNCYACYDSVFFITKDKRNIQIEWKCIDCDVIELNEVGCRHMGPIAYADEFRLIMLDRYGI